MSAQVDPRRAPSAARQRGQAIFLAAVFLLLGISAAIYTTLGSTSFSIASRQAENDARALAQVKDALIAWSASRTPTGVSPNIRPGELPCPDINPLDGYEDGSCVAGALGRVPWKTLGIPEPKDEAGETLWYAIAGPFRIYNMSSTPITSDTLGNIAVYHNPGSTSSTATTLTTQAVAVIFAPGASLGTQDRSSSTTMSCTAPSGTMARNLCASNYLEIAVGPSGNINNATINGPFIQAQSSTTPSFNDRLLVITNADLMPAVERRVAREMMSILEQYRIATGGDYPSANRANGNSDGRYNRHRFPCGVALPTAWGSGGTPSLPNWLTNGCGSNGWASVIFYAVGRNLLVGNNCSTCASTTITCPGTTTTSSTTSLTVTNASSRPADRCPAGASPFTCTPTVLNNGTANLILITPGAATSNRASGWPSTLTPISGYFEDSANNDNDDYNCFIVPTSTSYDRDRIYVVP